MEHAMELIGLNDGKMNNGAQQCICVRSISFQIDKILFHAKVVDEPIFMRCVCVPDVHTIDKFQCHLLSRFCDLKYVLSSFNIEGYFHPAPGHKKFTFDRIVLFFGTKITAACTLYIFFWMLSLKLQFQYIMLCTKVCFFDIIFSVFPCCCFCYIWKFSLSFHGWCDTMAFVFL